MTMADLQAFCVALGAAPERRDQGQPFWAAAIEKNKADKA